MKKTINFILIALLLGVSSIISAAEVILTPTVQKPTTTTDTSYTTTPSYSVFTKNLTIGSYGKDVMALKKIINLEFNTPLDGSATFTTNTANDIKKLQEKYAVDILIPNGLSSGTGFVGLSTIAKLNQLAAKHYILLDSFTLPKISNEKIYFAITLQLGSSGDDVSLLKIALNSDKDTKIITNSAEVTNIFDLATQIAVIKFQEKYANEILVPSGLTRGTGIVGPSTRKKLNSILNNILESTQTGTTSTTNTSSNYPYSYDTSAATTPSAPIIIPTASSADSTESCASLTVDLSYGQNNNSVYILQDFLKRKGYLQVTPTGYFGSLTVSAIKAFQIANGINPTGNADIPTRTKIQDIDCNYTNITIGTTNTTSITSTITPIANKTDSAAPTITLTANPAQVTAGQPTTLTWDSKNVIDQCKINAKDSAGNSFSSTIDSSGSKSTGAINKTTTYTVICYNKYGIPGSKRVMIEIVDPTKITTQKMVYAQASTINSITPSSGNRGDIVTIKGTGFLSTNSVIFDGVKIDSSLILSKSSSSISFKIPEYKSCLTTYCPPPAVNTIIETGGSKIIQVSNTNGFSNDFIFTLPSNKITIAGATTVTQYTPPKLTISYINPTNGNRGDKATVYGTGFSSDSIVFFGGFKVANNLILSKNSTSISFTIPPFQMGCTEPEYEVCPRLPLPGTGLIIETGGAKTVYVMNTLNKSTSTSATFTLPSKKITY